MHTVKYHLLTIDKLILNFCLLIENKLKAIYLVILIEEDFCLKGFTRFIFKLFLISNYTYLFNIYLTPMRQASLKSDKSYLRKSGFY